jgi:hypothetical protein
LQQSLVIRPDPPAQVWYYLAMARQQFDEPEAAAEAFDRAEAWLKQNRVTLDQDQRAADTTNRLQKEAAALLGR